MKIKTGDTVLVVEDTHYNYSQLGSEGVVTGRMLGCFDVQFNGTAASYRPNQLKLIHAVTLTQPDKCDIPDGFCAVCGEPLFSRRGAKTCSPKCRKALSRQSHQ